MAKRMKHGEGKYGYKIVWTEGGTTEMWYETAKLRDNAFTRDKRGLSPSTFKKFFKVDK